MSAKKKNIVIFFLALIIIAGAVGYYFYNKGPVDVKHATAIKTEAALLYQSFLKDSIVDLYTGTAGSSVVAFL